MRINPKQRAQACAITIIQVVSDHSDNTGVISVAEKFEMTVNQTHFQAYKAGTIDQLNQRTPSMGRVL